MRGAVARPRVPVGLPPHGGPDAARPARRRLEGPAQHPGPAQRRNHHQEAVSRRWVPIHEAGIFKTKFRRAFISIEKPQSFVNFASGTITN